MASSDRRALRILAIAGLAMVLVGSLFAAYVISQPCKVLVNPGCNIPDMLTMEASWINSPASLTLQLRDNGQHSVSLSGYYVKDSVGHLYADPSWMGPTIQPSSPTNVTFAIDGKDFTFQSNSTYTASVHDSEGYLVNFSVMT